jgi:putative ABC transport system permease protein
LITFCALLLAMGIAAVSAAVPQPLAGGAIIISFDGTLLLFLFAVFVLVTLISGFYPALVLSGFNPINALKSKVAPKIAGGISLRRALVVLQFCIAQMLIIGMLVVVDQMEYFKNTKLGFDKEAIVAVPVPGDSLSTTKYDTCAINWQPIPVSKTFRSLLPHRQTMATGTAILSLIIRRRRTDFGANLKWADTTYFKTYNLQFVAGRPYFNSDTVREFVVNESLVKKLGLRNPQDIIGKELNFWDGNKVAPVVGVIKDFHAASLRDPIPPVVMGAWKDVYQTMGLRYNHKNRKTLAHIEKTWTEPFRNMCTNMNS